jgi:PAS domain S-box-containing protein
VKSALLKLMDQMATAGSLQSVYRNALDCLQAILDVDRASVLVLDHAATMRFVAWTGLSEQYRDAVEGHSPWPSDATDAAPVLIGDVKDDAALAPYLPLLEQENIRALAFVPLRFGPKLLGKFMLYYAQPHAFSDEEIAIAQTIAAHVAFALEHHRIAAALEERLVAERELRRHAEREAALRQENERRLHLALACGRMGAWEWDIASGRLEWSDELESIHGLESGTFGGTFEAFRADVHPEDRARLESALEEALEGRRPDYAIEYRILPPDGRLRWVAAKGRVLYDSAGRPVRMVGICSDISERKRAEEARLFLADASRILATTLDPEATIKNLARIVVPRLADWCVVQAVDEQGRIAPVEVAHRDPEKIELGWRIVRRWRTRPQDAGGATFVVRTGAPALIARIGPEMLALRAQDGEHLRALESLELHSAITVPLQARGRVLGALSLLSAESKRTYCSADLRFVEEIASWAALALDNAQLYRQAQVSHSVAERARRQLEGLAEISDELASSLDPDAALKQLAARLVTSMADYCVTYAWDGRVIRRLGLAHRDPAKVPLVEALVEAGAPKLEDRWGAGAVIRTGEPILACEVSAQLIERSAQNSRHLHAVRELAPQSAMIVPLKARGRILGAIALATAGESGKYYDRNDLRLAVELASRAALLVDNARLYAQATSALRARDDMIAVVSHDLRNPLQSISAAAALLKLDPPPEHRARGVQSISLASAQMDRLLRDLLDISRMDAGEFSITVTSVDPASLIDEAKTLFRHLADERAVRLECRVARDLPAIAADRGRILQVLMNLLGNALKFVPSGGSITLAAVREADGVRLSVKDTGVGIAEEDLGNVFKRFWRADRSEAQGAGLGLAVAKGIVEAHGGRIGVKSRLGGGSTFYLSLRAAAPDDVLLSVPRSEPVLAADASSAL